MISAPINVLSPTGGSSTTNHGFNEGEKSLRSPWTYTVSTSSQINSYKLSPHSVNFRAGAKPSHMPSLLEMLQKTIGGNTIV